MNNVSNKRERREGGNKIYQGSRRSGAGVRWELGPQGAKERNRELHLHKKGEGREKRVGGDAADLSD